MMQACFRTTAQDSRDAHILLSCTRKGAGTARKVGRNEERETATNTKEYQQTGNHDK